MSSHVCATKEAFLFYLHLLVVRLEGGVVSPRLVQLVLHELHLLRQHAVLRVDALQLACQLLDPGVEGTLLIV
eukprot:scaffold384207_cov28-Prasinocladus_malaysianus.AAC.1